MNTATISSPPSTNLIIQTDIPLHDKNWFCTGGSARFYSEPTTAEQFNASLCFAEQYKLPLFILGSGANILVSDNGFDGLVIRPALTTITHEFNDNLYASVTAGAGVSMHNLIEYCLTHNILGLEEFSGIPGTVGGSLYINLHYFEYLLAHFLTSAQVIDKKSKEIRTVNTEWFKFGYNSSTLQQKEYFLISATFTLKQGTDLQTAFAQGKRSEIIRHRKKKYPTHHTCGSFFRNFLPHEVTKERNGMKAIWIAYYLDKIGVKGELHYGDAFVSYQHANMIVNGGNATSNDIIMVARTMQQAVKNKFDILPQPECQLIGFKEYPLL